MEPINVMSNSMLMATVFTGTMGLVSYTCSRLAKAVGTELLNRNALEQSQAVRFQEPAAKAEKLMATINHGFTASSTIPTEVDEFLMDWVNGSLESNDRQQNWGRKAPRNDFRTNATRDLTSQIPMFGSWSRLSASPDQTTKDLNKPNKMISSFQSNSKFIEEWIESSISSNNNNINQFSTSAHAA